MDKYLWSWEWEIYGQFWSIQIFFVDGNYNLYSYEISDGNSFIKNGSFNSIDLAVLAAITELKRVVKDHISSLKKLDSDLSDLIVKNVAQMVET